MDDERWDDIVDLIDERFGIDSTEKTQTARRDGSPEWRETVVFNVKGRRMKLERVSRPRVLDVKTFYARRRAGNASREEVTYSETERTHSVTLYEWSNGWQEVDLSEHPR